MVVADSDPSSSHQRRQTLKDADVGNTIRVLDSYPLTKYFDISQRLLDAFQRAVDGRRLDEAYVYGLRFAAFGVEALPRHQDWRRPTHAKWKRKNAQQVDKVLSMMEIIKQRMDAEESVRQHQEAQQQEERQRRRQEEELEQHRQQEEEERKQSEVVARLEKERQQKEAKRQAEQVQQQKSVTQQKIKKTVEQSALEKLQAMQSTIATSKPRPPGPKKAPATKDAYTPRAQRKGAPAVKAHEEQSASIEQNEESVPLLPSALGTPAKPTTSHPNASPRKQMTPRTSKEQKTIDMLERAIQAQEKRLEDIETTHVPALLKAAKKHLHNSVESDRKAALKCLAHKKTLERQVDVVKAAIFNMETQMFMLENAMEDRQVQTALGDASQAMKGLQEDATNMIDLATDLSPIQTERVDMSEDDDEDELMEELHQWLSPDELKQISSPTGMEEEDEDVSILSMPTVPASPAVIYPSSSTVVPQGSSSTVGRLLKAVLG